MSPRRSVLTVPASDARKTAKALASSADEVVLDLEDAVAPGEKDLARDLLATTLRDQPAEVLRRLAVRVNAPGTPWCHLDLVAVASLAPGPASVVLPKVESAGDLAFADRLLAGAESRAARPGPVLVQALIETAAGLARVQEIAHGSDRLAALVLGYADLAASLGMTAAPEARLDLWLPAQQAVLVAARSAGLQAVDGPWLGVDVGAAFARSVQRAGELGFDGKWAIHPRQVDALNAAFLPTAEQVQHAHDVLAALDRAAEGGAGAARLDGQMLDAAVALGARRVLSRVPEPAA